MTCFKRENKRSFLSFASDIVIYVQVQTSTVPVKRWQFLLRNLYCHIDTSPNIVQLLYDYEANPATVNVHCKWKYNILSLQICESTL